jgi:hypothetical protein
MAPAVAAVAIGSTVLGAVTSAQGAEYAGQAGSNMYNYQAQIAAMNAQIAKQNAAYDIASGEVQAQESGMQTRGQIGQTKAQQGAGNLDVNSGSAAQVRASEEQIGEFNQATIRANAVKAAYGEEVEATQFTAQSQLDTSAAQMSLVQGQFGAETSILGGVSSVSSKFIGAQQAGMISTG